MKIEKKKYLFKYSVCLHTKKKEYSISKVSDEDDVKLKQIFRDFSICTEVIYAQKKRFSFFFFV